MCACTLIRWQGYLWQGQIGRQALQIGQPGSQLLDLRRLCGELLDLRDLGGEFFDLWDLCGDLFENGHHAFVSNLDSNDVSVIDTEAKKVIATIPVGTAPVGIAIKESD